jgi:tetratricopeptide (TPR) repeat protein
MEGIRKWVWFLILMGAVMIPAAGLAETATGHYDLGVFAFQAGDYAGTEQHLKKALHENPNDAYVHYYLGKTCLKQDRLREAEGYFQSARRLLPEIPGLAYDMGTLYQKKTDYQRAAAEFEAVSQEDSSYVLALYHAGTSYFFLKQYDKALDFFNRSGNMSVSIKPSASYYAGICHYQMSRFDEALVRLDEAAATVESESMRADARRWAADIRARQSRENPLRLYARAGYLYDDNVGLAPLDSNTFSEKRDQAAVLFFSGKYTLPVNDQLDIGAGYSHYQTFYRDLDGYDLTGAIPEVFAHYRISQFTYRLTYAPSYYWVADDSYLMQHQIRPEIRWQFTDSDEAALSYGYSRNRYFTDDRRDGHANEVNLDLFRAVKPMDGFFYCGAGYEDNSATHPDEYFTEMTGRAGVNAGLLKTLRINFGGEYNDKNYDNRDSYYKKMRDDSRYVLSALLSWNPFDNCLGVAAEYTYSRNNSNIKDFDYKRNTTAVFVTAEF